MSDAEPAEEQPEEGGRDLTPRLDGITYGATNVGFRFDRHRRTVFLEQTANGVSMKKAARAAGVSVRTVYYHLKEDPFFRQAYDAAIIEASGEVVDALYQTALSGNTTAMIFWLTNRLPDEWRDKRPPPAIQQTFIGSGEQHVANVMTLPVHELREIAKAKLDAIMARNEQLMAGDILTVESQEVPNPPTI